MLGRTSRRTAIVADRRPLERGLARFLLEERGLFVVGEAATMADVLLQVQQFKPDLLVLHEKLALDHDPTVVAQIRRISARTSVVLLAASRDALPPELILLTDSVVEDGPGLTGLGDAVAGPTSEIDVPLGTEPIEAGAVAVLPSARSAASRWADRLQGLAVASIIALALVIARDMSTPTLVPTVVGRAHLVSAWESLGELESALTDATPEQPEQIAEIASALIDDRAAADAAGVSVTTFDHALAETLADLWPTLPSETQDLLIALFEDIIDDNDVSLPPPLPSPAPEPTPSPIPEPEPSPSPSEKPGPDELPVPHPAGSPSPPPTETTTAPETTTPPAETSTPPPETTTPPAETTPPPAEATTPPPTETTTSPTETTTAPTETTTAPTETTTTPTETTTTPTETTTSPTETTTTTTPPPETTTTPPAETTTPPAVESETQSWSLALVPFALTLLVAISGWARRRWRDTPGDADGSDPS
jgi:hypothetical protein